MANPDLIPVPFAQDGDKNPIPLERIISDPSYRATWLEGFPPDTRIPEEVGGEAPDGLDFNGLFNALSQAVVFLQKGNAYQFDAIMAPYPVGALVRSNDNLTTYQSTIAENSNNPNINMTGWRVYNSSSFVVDNLTTNDSAKALSAEQGKVLNDKMLGVGQTWQDVSSSRASAVTYTNTTNRPIFISIYSTVAQTQEKSVTLYVDGVRVGYMDTLSNDDAQLTAIIPPNSKYNVFFTGLVLNSDLWWVELR